MDFFADDDYIKTAGNFYMTPFQCNVVGAKANMPKIAPPQDPVVCNGGSIPCTKGSKRPLYAYNNPTNIPFYTNENRPGKAQ